MTRQTLASLAPAPLPRLERVLFWLSILAATSLMWLAPRLPMVDLPQHAAQVALWRDLITGQSPWSELVRINLFTPYLIGYGLLLPLSFILPMNVATQLLVSVAFLAFIGVCILLRRELRGDPRLDWLFFLSYFGFCWKWGFLTFLVASPVGLLTLLMAIRHAKAPTYANGLRLVLSGLVLLFSHGLVFLGLMFISGLQMLEGLFQARGRQFIARIWPFVLLGAATLAFRLITQNMDGALHAEGYLYGTPLWQRPSILLADITDTNDDSPSQALTYLSLAVLIGPILLGAKLNRLAALMPISGLVLILACAPADAFQTGGLYYRFALFIPPFVALAFRQNDEAPAANWRWCGAMSVIIIASWAILFEQGMRIRLFAEESRSFETVLAAAEPGKRMLMYVVEGDSRAAQNSNVYWHYPAWYQAEKHGFVDFNFALFPPQVIRFRLDRDPGENAQVDMRVGEGMWREDFITKYSYVITRALPSYVRLLKDLSPCPMTIKAYDGLWFLLERQACPAR